MAPKTRGSGQTAVVQRCVSENRDMVLLTIGQQVTLDLTAVEVVQHLIGDNRVLIHYLPRGTQLPQGEVAHADVAHLTAIYQGFHGLHSFLDGYARIGPVDLVQINDLRTQETQTGVNGA